MTKRKPRSEETKEKIRKKLQGRSLTTQHKQNIKMSMSKISKHKFAFWKDKKFTEKHKRNIRAAMHTLEVHKKCSVWSKDNLPPNLEYAQSKSPFQKGSKNINWNPDKQDEYGYEFNRHLKKRILERDNYKCQNCTSSKRLVVHHKDEDKLNNVEDNLVVLCRTCHMKVHHCTLQLQLNNI